MLDENVYHDNSLVTVVTCLIVKYNASAESGRARWVIIRSNQELKLLIKRIEILLAITNNDGTVMRRRLSESPVTIGEHK